MRQRGPQRAERGDDVGAEAQLARDSEILPSEAILAALDNEVAAASRELRELVELDSRVA